jgi:hypothetical protein
MKLGRKLAALLEFLGVEAPAVLHRLEYLGCPGLSVMPLPARPGG